MIKEILNKELIKDYKPILIKSNNFKLNFKKEISIDDNDLIDLLLKNLSTSLKGFRYIKRTSFISKNYNIDLSVGRINGGYLKSPEMAGDTVIKPSNRDIVRIALADTTEPNNASDYTQAEGYNLTQESNQENIYGGEIQDKGVTTNDPIARQLVMLGVGR